MHLHFTYDPEHSGGCVKEKLDSVIKCTLSNKTLYYAVYSDASQPPIYTKLQFEMNTSTLYHSIGNTSHSLS